MSKQSKYERDLVGYSGSRSGFWRLHTLLTSHRVPVTVFAVGMALERNESAARAMQESGWEIASHGYRWIDYQNVPEDEEREHIRSAETRVESAY
mmetsp:Transcript_45962/g.98027  ORF Transcript_45962/g.98027 Transcript_45962/m.98027 type:complete len:95 (-) Transcript_45962:108-392(-)